MKLVCVARFVPDGDWMDPVGDNHAIKDAITIKEGCRTKLCPDDAAALAFALSLRKGLPDLSLQLLALAPRTAIPQIEDLLRLGVDKAILLPASVVQASDSVTIAKGIGDHIAAADPDWILIGSDASGHEAAPLAPALAGILGLDHLSGICRVDETQFQAHQAELSRREGRFWARYAVRGPAILGFDARADYAMPYLRIKDKAQDVSDRLICLPDSVPASGSEGANDEISARESDKARHLDAVLGLKSLTKKQTKPQGGMTSPRVVDLDDEGIEQVYRFLQQKRLI